MNSELMNLLLVIVVFGLCLWLVNVYIPMAGAIKSLLNVVVLVVLVIYVLQFFAVIPVILPMIRIIR